MCDFGGAFLFLFQSSFLYLGCVFHKTNNPLGLVGFAMIIASSLRWLSTISKPTRARGIIVKRLYLGGRMALSISSVC